jgi:hypothetical protein
MPLKLVAKLRYARAGMKFPHPKLAFSAALLAAIGAAGSYALQAPGAVAATAPLPLKATPIALDRRDPAHMQVGRLRYMGGLVLKSSDKSFGGLSALRSAPGGRLLSVSDTGNWVSFVTVERDGILVGVRDGVIAPLRDVNGAVPADKSLGDAESLEWNPATGDAVVSFEQDHRRQYYRGIDPARPETLVARAWQVTRDPRTAGWPSNSGGEALADIGNGGAVLFSENPQGADGSNDLLVYLPGTTARLGFRPPDDFHPTDAHLLSPGRLLVLERSFSPSKGVAGALVEVDIAAAVAAIAAHQTPPEPVLTGIELARFAPPLSIDNMEGLALVRQGERTFVYLVSDDNFNPLQRTLLLKFELLAH